MQYSDWITYVCTLLEYQVVNPASATMTPLIRLASASVSPAAAGAPSASTRSRG